MANRGAKVPTQTAPQLVASLGTPQQAADHLPGYAIYADPAGTPNRSRSRSLYPAPVARNFDEAGYQLSSPSDPAAPPPIGATVPGLRRPVGLRLGAPRLMLEPSRFVPGKGWVNTPPAP
jgi:hypothetical protein